MVLAGGLLLTLPIAARSRQWSPLLDARFISTSAVCSSGPRGRPRGGIMDLRVTADARIDPGDTGMVLGSMRSIQKCFQI